MDMYKYSHDRKIYTDWQKLSPDRFKQHCEMPSPAEDLVFSWYELKKNVHYTCQFDVRETTKEGGFQLSVPWSTDKTQQKNNEVFWSG